MNVKEYQQFLKNKLSSIYNGDKICVEWRTKLLKGTYSPRVDVAIGPFAIEDRYENQYNQLHDDYKIKKIIHALYNFHCINLEIEQSQQFSENLKYFNSNARCFMGIEIENNVSSKHLMGGIINVSALSRIGILVPWNLKKYELSKRMIKYFEFLKRAEKNSFETKNVLIVKQDQLLSAINSTTN